MDVVFVSEAPRHTLSSLCLVHRTPDEAISGIVAVVPVVVHGPFVAARREGYRNVVRMRSQGRVVRDA